MCVLGGGGRFSAYRVQYMVKHENLLYTYVPGKCKLENLNERKVHASEMWTAFFRFFRWLFWLKTVLVLNIDEIY